MDNFRDVRASVMRWAKKQYRIIQNQGVELSDGGVELARSVGVLEPTRIRVLLVDISGDPVVGSLAKSAGVLNG